MTGTNALLLIPVVAWVVAGFPMCSIALLASVFASFAYHCSGEQRWHKTDVFLAVLALVVTLGATVPHMSVPEALLAGLILALALALKRLGTLRSYDHWHSAWHVAVAGGQLFLVTCTL